MSPRVGADTMQLAAHISRVCVTQLALQVVLFALAAVNASPPYFRRRQSVGNKFPLQRLPAPRAVSGHIVFVERRHRLTNELLGDFSTAMEDQLENVATATSSRTRRSSFINLCQQERRRCAISLKLTDTDTMWRRDAVGHEQQRELHLQ